MEKLNKFLKINIYIYKDEFIPAQLAKIQRLTILKK
jgi:hypothetical protein